MTPGEIVLTACLAVFVVLVVSASLAGFWPAVDDEPADPTPYPGDARD